MCFYKRFVTGHFWCNKAKRREMTERRADHVDFSQQIRQNSLQIRKFLVTGVESEN